MLRNGTGQGGTLDAISLILNALTSGAARGIADSATDSVSQAYSKLRHLLSGRFTDNKMATLVLAEHTDDPLTWQAPMSKALTDSGASTDPAIIQAAQLILTLLDEAGTKAGKYRIDLRHTSGVQIGDSNNQINVFNARHQAGSGSNQRHDVPPASTAGYSEEDR